MPTNLHRRAQLNSRTWTILLAVACGIIGMAVLTYRLLRPLVTATTAVRGTVVEAFYATGTISPKQEYPLKSHVAGIVIKMHVDKGAVVKKDQVLAVVEDTALPLKKKQAEAEVREKQARADDAHSPVLKEFDNRILALVEIQKIAKREEDRLIEALAKNASSQADLDRALDKSKQVWSDLESARSMRAVKKLELDRELSVAQAVLDIASREEERQTITSPIDGVVLDRPVTLGTRLAINDHIMQVADVRPEMLVMRAQVDEEDKVALRGDQKVTMTLYAFPGRTFSGSVQQIYPQADHDRRTFEVDVALDHPDEHLAAGLTGELAFIVGIENDGLIVPRQAVQSDTVWLVRNGKLAKVAVTIGRKNVERAQITSGVKEGETVVISPPSGLKARQGVRVDLLDPEAAVGLNKSEKKTEAPMKFN